MTRTLVLFSLLLAPLSTALAQQDFEFWPGANYDPTVPTMESVIGHAPGERNTWPGWKSSR